MKKIDSPTVGAACVRARFPLAAVALAAVTLSQGVVAQEARLGTTVVTAARSETKLDETLADVTVITREQIENIAPSHSLVDVLQRLGGGGISSNGGRGASQSIYMRGTNGGHTLLLVDGVRYGSASMGAPVLENIPLEQIERIELVKGPASALYGSDAIGGVIQIFTKRGDRQDKALNGSASATLGKHGHKSSSASLYGKQKGFDYQIGVSRLIDHGFSATNPHAGPYYSADRDAFDQTATNIALGYQLHADWRIDTSFLNSEGRTFTDGDYGGTANTFVDLRTQVSHLKLTGKITDAWTSKISLGASKDVQANWGSAWGDSRYETKQTEYKWENTVTTGAGIVMAGVERLEQKLASTTVYSSKDRTIDALFLGLNGGYANHTWQLNLRRDDNSQFGDFDTYGVAYGYALGGGVRMFASHGKSMRAPSFNDLYYFYASGSQYNGNPNLKPEEGHNNELGTEWSQHAHKLKVVAFDNRISNLIASLPSVGMSNVEGKTKLKGWSLDYGWAQAGWTFAASYSHLNARQANGLVPSRRAKHQASLNLEKKLGRWQLGGNALYVGRRFDSDANGDRVVMKSYATLDAYANYQVTPDWSVQARVANVTNRDYETAYGFNQLGRAAYVTLKWAPR